MKTPELEEFDPEMKQIREHNDHVRIGRRYDPDCPICERRWTEEP